jgi:peptide subunit release factor 1 (eRF1)/intein/homing endonuclease
MSNSTGTNGKKYDSVALYRIRKLLSDLSNKTGRGTELVTLYLPPKKPIHEAIAALREESGTASNIKSDTTRTHVQNALTKTMQRLRLYKQTPENGLVIFCGAIPGPGGPGNETIELFEVIPNKPVTTYLYRCLGPESKILLQNGMTVTIGELQGSWEGKMIKSTKEACSRLEGAKIRDYLKTSVGERKVYQIASESGRQLIATEDHPFFTPTGWKKLRDIKVGSFIAVYPSDDLENRNKDSTNLPVCADEILVDELAIRNLTTPPANIELTIRRLRQRGLLPLLSSNPKLPLISRILGHLFTDGSFTHNTESRNGNRYSHFTVDLCLGDESSENEIREDLVSLGCDVATAFHTSHMINVDDRSYTSKTIHIKLRDTAFCTLLRTLGAPIGSNVRKGTVIPPWLFRAPIRVRREFLASYMGGDGEAPTITKSNPVGAIRITFHRIESLRDRGMEFAQDLSLLFSSFGVNVNAIKVFPGYARKDGLNTLGFELRFALSEENVLKICHAIGYRYATRKASAASLVGEYLRIRSYFRALSEEKMKLVAEMYSAKSTVSQIATTIFVSERTVRSWGNAKVLRPLVRSSLVPEFSTWLSFSRVNPGELLLWETVTSIEKVEVQDVRDLTVDNTDHSFFANGFLVHNCDDHFHLDPLREMLKEENVVGILAMDATEAGFGIVSGDSWEVVDVTSSGVSGKTRKGGQCVSEDTLVQLEDGKLAPISELTVGSKIASFNFTDYSPGVYECSDTFTMIPDSYYVIDTVRPKMRILATGEHRFFTVTSDGVTTLEASQLEEKDRLIVSRTLPEPGKPDPSSRFPTRFTHKISQMGVEILKKERLRKQLSQTEFASKIGLHQTEISQLERGERILTWDKLMKVIDGLIDDRSEFLAAHIERTRTLPEYFSPELLQLLGYITGDGSVGKNRVSLYEQRLQVAEYYSELAKKVLKLDYAPILTIDKTNQSGSFAKHAYYETRIYSKDFSEALKRYYPELVARERAIPDRICRLGSKELAYFIRGLFDAEAHAREKRIGIAMKSGIVIRQLQLLLLRFRIISSYGQQVNRFGSTMDFLDISDLTSLKLFLEKIGFTATDKRKKLEKASKRVFVHSYLNVPVIGSWVDKRVKAAGIRREAFRGSTNFFSDTRGISKPIFHRVVSAFENALEQERISRDSLGTRTSYLRSVLSELSMIENSQLTLAVVKKIRLQKNLNNKKFVDIELPVTQSFIGNGFVLHNSARRYERLREMELSDYYNRLADHAKKAFLESNHVKGLIVSGPGPTKDTFVKDGYLDYRLQNMIVGTLDTGYAGREGVRETIEKSGKLLENVRVVEERKLVQKFLREVNSDSGLAIYGIQDILASLKRAAVDTILVNDDTGTLSLKATCQKCGEVREKFIHRSNIVQEKQNLLSSPCPKCSSLEMEIKETDIVDYLADASIDSGANVEVISSKTEDGAMLKSFGGIAALLRYRT